MATRETAVATVKENSKPKKNGANGNGETDYTAESIKVLGGMEFQRKRAAS